MNHVTLSSRFALMFLLFAAATAAVAQQPYRFAGRVTDVNGDAVAGATLTIRPRGLEQPLSVVTGPDGAFDLAASVSGPCSVVVRADGFATLTAEERIPATQAAFLLQPGPVAVDVMVTTSTLAGSEASLDDLPGSIDRLDAHTLTPSRVFNFSEALRKLPGISVRDEEGFGLRPNICIRGTNPTRSTKVLLLEDGLPLAYAPYGDNASYYHPPVERYDSVEVLKGSSQILYGPQTIAGVVNYITPNPTQRPSFEMLLTGGNARFFNGSFTGSGTIGRTGILAQFTRKQGDGSRENTSSRLNDLSAKVVQTLTDRQALTFKFSYYGEDSNVTYSGLTLDEFRTGPRYNPFRNDRFYGDRFGFSVSHAAVLSHRASLVTSAYANRFSRDWWRQSSNSSQRPNRLNLDPDCRSMADLNTTCGNEGRLRRYGTYGVEPRFTYSYDAGNAYRGELQAGVRIHWEHQHRRQLNGDLPDSRDGVPAELNERRNFAQSAYAQHRFVFGTLAVTPGIRLERIRAERTNLLATPAAHGRTTITAVVPGIGVAYSGLPRVTVFAGVHRGFSPPRAEDIISNTGGVIELDPELSWNYEAGIRSVPVQGWRIEAAVFRLDYQNQIIAASLAGGTGALLTNGGRTLQQGAEVSSTLEAGRLFRTPHNVYLRTAITWLPVAEFRGTRFSSVTPAVSITGNRLPYVPESQFTTVLGYSHPRGFHAFVENVFTGGQFSDDLNTVNVTPNGQRGYIPSQNYWNATANYAVERMRTTFFVTAKNLTDRSFVVDRSRGILPSTGRRIQAGVHVRF